MVILKLRLSATATVTATTTATTTATRDFATRDCGPRLQLRPATVTANRDCDCDLRLIKCLFYEFY